MKLTVAVLLLLSLGQQPPIASAFQTTPFARTTTTHLRSSAATQFAEDSLSPIAAERLELLTLAESLKDKNGILVVDAKGKQELDEAAKRLETTAVGSSNTDDLVGDWNLVCSTAMASVSDGPLAGKKLFGIDTEKLPFFNAAPVQDLRNLANKAVAVKQIVKATAGEIDRVDHVIQYSPPDSLTSIFSSSNVPEALRNIDLNPLQVSAGKVVLVHKAEVKKSFPVIDIKLNLQSVVLNVAGTSQRLDPNGEDIIGLNVPISEFVNGGDFQTTYMDDTLRISRSRIGIVDQLRIFTRPSVIKVEKEEGDEETIGDYTDDDIADDLLALDDDAGDSDDGIKKETTDDSSAAAKDDSSDDDSTTVVEDVVKATVEEVKSAVTKSTEADKKTDSTSSSGKGFGKSSSSSSDDDTDDDADMDDDDE
mmetsp:Transcript_1223/g.2894  ORF Transcript_1223/g.2894 Transcript_1223/m.2894 type:complete len:422 (-) Transcript_1223:260-1525(-)|eukprot:CAMPEP_0119558878 /NCGR_PEP_ID=MMETSP1352-20130426/11462_1 /TAXON_ID=265584 /ORGANISM="Stauroneis constricta, Strain CCMP1120" /LENGTH=421 /DNA_ID=CAMNT_0007606369 /DNA_START=148 /DNA_END=1413 /DNA_ORIENTATION=+